MTDRINRVIQNFRVLPDSVLGQAVSLRCISGEKHETLWYSTRRSNMLPNNFTDDMTMLTGVAKLDGWGNPIPLRSFREARLKFKLAMNRNRSAVQIPLHWLPSWFNHEEMVNRARGDIYLTGKFPLYHSDITVQVLIKIIAGGSPIPYWCLYIGSMAMSQRELMAKGRKLRDTEAHAFLSSQTSIFNWVLKYPYWD